VVVPRALEAAVLSVERYALRMVCRKPDTLRLHSVGSYVVPADASMSRAYRLFRTMGLRHMFVGPPQQKVCSSPLLPMA